MTAGTILDRVHAETWRDALRSVAEKWAPTHREPRWAAPADVARALDPNTRQTPALDLIDRELIKLRDEPDGRLIITIGPQEGKSRRVARDFPIWWLAQFPDAAITIASYAQALANRNGRAIRRAITTQLDFPHPLARDQGAAGDWSLAGYQGGVFSVGIGGGLTGRQSRLMIIDDPIKNQKEADSEAFRETVWDWMTGVVYGRLAPAAPIVVILTRWHEDDLAGRLLRQEGSDWRVLNIPAKADHDPLKGESDVLGRAPGEYMISAQGRTREQWERREREAGPRDWQAQYQGAPSPPGGAMFKRDAWRFYDQPVWLVRPDGSRWVVGSDTIDFAASWDMTFKDTAGTDYVSGQVWMRRGAEVLLLDRVSGRWDFIETCRQFRTFSAKWPQAVLKIVEDKANGPAVIAALRRIVPGIVPEEPQGSKTARAAAVTPLFAAGQVLAPAPEIEGCAWVGDVIEQAAAFPHGRHDDDVDAMSQAINRLILQPLLTVGTGRTFEPDEFTRQDAMGWSISPY